MSNQLRSGYPKRVLRLETDEQDESPFWLQQRQTQKTTTTTRTRPTKTLACSPLALEGEPVSATSDIQVTFEVETEQEIEDLSSEVASKLTTFVQGAAVEAVHYTVCELVLDKTTGRKPTAAVRLAQCLYSVSSATNNGGGDELAYCQDASIPNCVSYQGTIKVFHAAECAGEMDMAALLALEVGVETKRFADSINSRLSAFDNAVSAVRVVEDEEPVVVTGISTEETADAVNDGSGSLSSASSERRVAKGGFLMIGLSSLLLLMLLVLFFVIGKQRRSRRSYNNNSDDLKSVETDDDDDDQSNALNSYNSADRAEFARRNSKMDVHRCTCEFCPVCISNPDDIHMVTVPNGQKDLVPDAFQEYEAREECFETVAMPGPDKKPRLNPLRTFRRNKNTQFQLVRVATAAPSVEPVQRSNGSNISIDL